MITFDRCPENYRHWRLAVDGRVATLVLDVDEEAAIRPGYKLKLNSYDLGVDIELHDALQRIRFEHPTVGCTVLTGAKDRMFCAGANIYMLGASSHAWKVNFCKFTNETRNGLEDSSRHEGLKFIAGLNGTTAGGGYEIALACDEICLIDDGSTVVSLPEVSLLGVLPGTGGLSRVVDKRKVRRDLADIFCTTADGVRAARAREWGLVDFTASPNAFPGLVRERAEALAKTSKRPVEAQGITLRPLEREIGADGIRYRHVRLDYDRARRVATLTLRAPDAPPPKHAAEIHALGDAWWPLAFARELDDALLMLRTNEPELGLVVMRTEGDGARVLDAGTALADGVSDWLVRETIALLRRTLARLEVTSRSLYAVIDEGSCFAGLFLEFALAADRSYMLAPSDGNGGPFVVLDRTNFGFFPTVNALTRLETRFNGRPEKVEELRALMRKPLNAGAALAQGLVTVAPDDLDWEDELRLAIEERTTLSPDALTGMEASLRFPGPETLATKIFGRLSAWQNWVFHRPNSTGERGALKLFGSGSKPQFDWERV